MQITEPRPCISRIRGYLSAAQGKPRVLGILLKIITRPAAICSIVSSPFLQKIIVYWLNTVVLSAMERERESYLAKSAGPLATEAGNRKSQLHSLNSQQ